MKTLVAEFTVDGEPISKARARFTNYKSKTRAYTPERTRVGEERVLAAFLQVAKPTHDTEVAFGVEVEFLHQTGQRRDIDNMLKLILDALNKVAWPDDVQVTSISANKRRVPKGEAQTIVRIYTLGRIEKPRGICIGCGSEFPQFASTSTRKYCTRQCGYEYQRNNRTKACANCGGSFLSRGDMFADRCCSIACNSEYKRVTLTCIECGDAFTKPRSVANKGRALCSVECRTKWHREARRTAARTICPGCGGPKSKKAAELCRACRLATDYPTMDRHVRKPEDGAA